MDTRGGWVGEWVWNPLCDSPSGRCFFTGPWAVTHSSLRMLRRVAALCRPLRPVLLLVSFPRSRSPVVGVLGLCWLWQGMPFARQRRPGILGLCWLLQGSPLVLIRAKFFFFLDEAATEKSRNLRTLSEDTIASSPVKDRGRSGRRSPPPRVLTWAKFWFRGQKCGNTGSPCLEKPVLPRGTRHRTHVAGITQPHTSKHDKGRPTGQHAPQNTRAHGITATPTH